MVSLGADLGLHQGNLDAPLELASPTSLLPVTCFPLLPSLQDAPLSMILPALQQILAERPCPLSLWASNT